MNSRARIAIISASVALTLPAVSLDGATLRDLEPRTITHGGSTRTYHVHYPGRVPPTTARPAVFVLHGGGGADARELARRTGFNAIADREGFIVVYPEGIDGQWNDGRGATFRRGRNNDTIDDVGFVGAVIDALVRSGEVDARRVYVTGASNGGMMTFRIGIELGTKVAAIAAVIANLPTNLASRMPTRSLPVLVINGTADPMVPWNGGPVRVLGRSYGTVLSTEETMRFWTRVAGISQPATVRQLDDRVPDDRCRVEVHSWGSAGGENEVVLYALHGAGHNLPGGATPDRPRVLGPQCREVNGSEVTWEFFGRHRLPS